jgi:hypothetical protein
MQAHLGDADVLKEGMMTLSHQLPLVSTLDALDPRCYRSPGGITVETAEQIWTTNSSDAGVCTQALMLWHQRLDFLDISIHAPKARLVTALERALSSPGGTGAAGASHAF